MSKTSLSSLKTIIFIMIFGGAIGALYTTVVYLSQPNPQGTIWVGIAIGVLLSGAASAFEVIIVGQPNSRIRALPFYASFIIRILVHLSIILISILIVQTSYSAIIGESVVLIGGDVADTITDIGFSTIIIAGIIFWMQMRTFIGQRTLKNLILGKYNKPQSEERIFMIVDVVGSTKAAQKIGDSKFHSFLNRLFILFDKAIHENGGEVHSYIGDAILVVWSFSENEKENSQVFDTVNKLQKICTLSQTTMLSEFGVKPEIRVVIHGGPVVVGEMGHRKRQITYLGNTLNLTARLETLAKDLGETCLVSNEVLSRSILPAGLKSFFLGEKAVKGSAKKLAVSSIVIEAD